LSEFFFDVFRAKVYASDKAFVLITVVKTYNRYIAAAVWLQPVRFNIKTYSILLKKIIEPPVLTAFQFPAEITGVARIQFNFIPEEALVKKPFSFTAESK
jgi:hypothetical protein